MDFFDIKISCDGDLHEQISRRQRLYFVAGHIIGSIGSAQFLNSLHDRKGTLTANITGRHQGLEDAVKDAWAEVGEDQVEFVFERPMDPDVWEKCKTCNARLFCES